MKSLYQHIRFRINHFGREGVIGLVLIALCLPFYLLAAMPMLENVEKMHIHIDELKESLRNNAGDVDRSRRESPAEQLSTYYKSLPLENSSPEWLKRIYQAARDEKVGLNDGDYRVIDKKGGKVVQYQINLPAKGSYLQIRRFLAKALNEVPNISLDQIIYEREKIRDSSVDANIRLTLYLRAES